MKISLSKIAKVGIPEQSQMLLSPVKVLTPCVVAIVIALSPAHVAGQQQDSSLIAFWRDVFARPDAQEITRVTNASSKMIELGRELFVDPRLSRDDTRACASCHLPNQGFSDARARAQGRDGRDLERNTPTLYNAGWGSSFNWDGSEPTLERQASGPIEHQNEMGGNFREITERLRVDAETTKKFNAAFSSMTKSTTEQTTSLISRQNIVTALAAFVRSIVAPMTRFDAWVAGNENALSASEKSGFSLFVGKGGCVGCHAGWRFTDDGFHDIGLPNPYAPPNSDTAGKKGIMAFKTPTLRALKSTAPYMHDGSLKSLEDVVAHYASRIDHRKGIAELLKKNIDLSARERADLVAFLKTL